MRIEESIKIYGAKIDELLKELIPPHRNDYLSAPIWHHMRTGETSEACTLSDYL